jgi:hypothetical protein
MESLHGFLTALKQDKEIRQGMNEDKSQELVFVHFNYLFFRENNKADTIPITKMTPIMNPVTICNYLHRNNL